MDESYSGTDPATLEIAMTEFDARGISPEQLGELTKQFLRELSGRSHAEACAIMEKNPVWDFRQLFEELGDFRCDWTPSDLGYPQAYTGLRPIEEQVNLIADHFKLDRGPAMRLLKYGLPDVPKWSEGWAAFPIQELLKGTHYVDHVEKALIWHSGVCGNTPGHYSSSRGLEGLRLEEHVRPHFDGRELGKLSCPRKNFAWEWKERIGGRIMIAPVQMGLLRRGQSDRMVRAYCTRAGVSEFPLGIFEVACLLAMHPSRVPDYLEQALHACTPGDEYNPEGHIKTQNCRWKQMGYFWRLRKNDIPCFGFGQDNIRDKQNGPVTASRWNINAHLDASWPLLR